MKTYEKQKYSGNENGWHEPIVSLGKTKINDATATELNSHFRNTGVKYVESTGEPFDEPTTTDAADHGEHNLVVKDGKFTKTKNKPADKAKEVAKEIKDGTQKIAGKGGQKDSKPGADDAFVKSDQTVKHAEHEDKSKAEPQVTTAGE